MTEDYRLDTLAVRAGIERSQFGEHSEALYLTSSFVFKTAAQAAARFGNQEPLHGHEEIGAANAGFFSTIESLSHAVTGLWESDDTVIVRIDATYVRLDRRSVTVPAVSIIQESDGLIVDYQVFVDMAPIFA